MIDGVTNSQALPVLERLTQFAAGRHRLIVDAIANLDTPGYRPLDVSVEGFRRQLGEAIDARRATGGGELPLRSTRQVEVTGRALRLHGQPVGHNVLFHDGNDRDLDRTMQSLVENLMTFRVAAELLRSRFQLLGEAIRERPA